jgi:hypothetical protein
MADSCLSDKPDTVSSMNDKAPPLGCVSKPKMLSRVDFPEPDGPDNATISPGSRTRFTSFRTGIQIASPEAFGDLLGFEQGHC